MTNFDKLHSMSKEDYLKWLNSEFVDYEEIEKKRKAEQENCPYCNIDNNLECLQEHFKSPDSDLDIGLSCGAGEVSIIVNHNSDTAVLVTQGKYCAYCGRKLVIDTEENAKKEWKQEAEKTTNFEKIKNMTVKEMVEFINCEGACNYCIYSYDDNCKGLKCREGVKAWLKQEAEE